MNIDKSRRWNVVGIINSVSDVARKVAFSFYNDAISATGK